jgi:hypothetical protein
MVFWPCFRVFDEFDVRFVPVFELLGLPLVRSEWLG